ncbi:MAG: group 1 truncated hemoglobin [Gemmatimonadetes bacterium]|nr:group 1 truncated hemoglobin [Gemmatimonadota bacterium]MBI2535995.1 group 1 truncated hemoglobin [Gemmatimonadota bacterium]
MLLMGCGAQAPTPAAAPAVFPRSPGTLYHRVGGYDALAAMVDDFLGRMLQDPQIEPFFRDLQTGEKQRVRQMLVDQLCEATGGPCVYVGKDMKTAHTGLEINEQDWTRAVGHLVATLELFRVPAKEREELLSAVAGLKDQIVGQ